jgi:hypothetical protein
MRKLTLVAVLVVAGAAHAAESKKDKEKEAVAAATKIVDKHDAAYQTRNTEALIALLDKSFFGAGPTMSSHVNDLEAAKKAFGDEVPKTGRFVRNSITLHGCEAGDTVWYIADYLWSPKVGPGILAVRRTVRESGVIVKRGTEWKIAMLHSSLVEPDPTPAPPATPPPAPPAK